MYAPRGVWTDGQRVIVADTGNHRVLIWHNWPDRDGAEADVVLGQPGFGREGPAAGGGDTERGLHLPTGVTVIGGRLVVADAWHHRLLAWNGIPGTHFARATWVLGQPDLGSVAPNRGGPPDLASCYWPFGLGVVAGVLWVADTGNRRVLGWHVAPGELPDPGSAADILLGQDDAGARADNRGDLGGDSFRWPHAIAGDGATLYVADAGDHRVLGWSPPPVADRPAALVLGQPGADVAAEFKNQPQGAARMRFPYALACDDQRLLVADTANNRILGWRGRPERGTGIPADWVLGQPDMDANGENRWDRVSDDSLCWPYGLCLAGDLLAVADSGNNRVMLWRLS